jgi:hypothetical protein
MVFALCALIANSFQQKAGCYQCCTHNSWCHACCCIAQVVNELYTLLNSCADKAAAAADLAEVFGKVAFDEEYAEVAGRVVSATDAERVMRAKAAALVSATHAG